MPAWGRDEGDFPTVSFIESHGLYALAWLSFGAGHSALASAGAKGRLRFLGAGYRLTYNAVAVLHLAGVGAVGWMALGDQPDFDLHGLARGIMAAVQVAGWVLLAVGLRCYDLGRLGGISPLRWARDGRAEPEDEPLRTAGLNGYLRHPLYSAGFLILWGRAVDPMGLATAIWASAYLVIGARLEERRLVALYGDAYVRYRAAVPAFIPRISRRHR